MPRRKVGDPQIFPGATVPVHEDVQVVDGQPAYIYLTDSTETNRVRAPLAVGAAIEVRCLFANRELTREEERTFRHDGQPPNGISVSPRQVACMVTAPGGGGITPNVSLRDGIYVAKIVVARVGGWYYQFVGRGDWEGTRSRAFDIR